ncbi:MAG: hypothetical protein HN757_12610 [Calditrichaeota bacterium]|jgi:uncharacterized damage-inducible protein DinB|nr:hypothetical protein [Calditrichota bacterium]
MKDSIVESWLINNRVNLKLLDAICNEGLNCTLSKRGGRTVALQFVHLHNLRLWRIDRFAKDLYGENTKIDPKGVVDRLLLRKCLSESAESVSTWFEAGMSQGGKIRGFKRGAVAMMCYFIAHESHHRGSIMLTLKQNGFSVQKDIRDGIWAWNQI